MAPRGDYTGVPEVAPSLELPDNFQHIQASPNAFGAQVAQAGGRVGADIQDLAAFHDTVSADDAGNNYIDAATKIRAKLMSKAGADALNYAPEATAELNQTYSDISDSLHTPQARHLFDQNSRRFRAMVMGDVDDYAARQSKVYAHAVNDTTINSSDERAAQAELRGDNEEVAHATQMAKDAAGLNFELEFGFDADPALKNAAVAKVERGVVVSRVSALEPHDPIKALKLLDDNAGLMASAAGYDELYSRVRNRAQESQIGPMADQTVAQIKSLATAPGAAPAANLGNVRSGPNSFANPAAPVDGVILAANNLRNGYRGLTLQQIANKWAPAGDGNNPQQWAATVGKASGIAANVVPNLNDPATLNKLLSGIAVAEKSQQDRAQFTPAIISQGVQAWLSGKQAQLSEAPAQGGGDLESYYKENYPKIADGVRAQAEALYPGDVQFANKAVEQVTRQMNEAITTEKQHAAGERVALTQTIEDSTAKLERGIQVGDLPTDAQVDAAYPKEPERAQIVKDRLADLRDMNGYVGVLPLASPSQIATLRQQAAPDPAKPDYAGQVRRFNALDSVIRQRGQEIDKDSARYVLTAQPNLTGMLKAGLDDPHQFGPYAQAMEAAQHTMGVPAGKQHLLPASVAQGLAKDIQSDPANAPAKLDSYARHFGFYWPHVFRDASTVGGLSAQYQSVATLPVQDGVTLSRALADGAKSAKAVRDLVPTEAAGAIDKGLDGNQSVTQLKASLLASGSSLAQVSGLTDSIKALAYGNIMYHGDDAATAWQKAVKSFTSRYEFIGRARVPADKFDTVTRNASAALNGLDDKRVALPAIIGQPGAPTAQQYLETLKAAPTWITSPRADALWLMDMGGRIVRDRHGNPIAVPFAAPPPATPDATEFDKQRAALGAMQ